MHGWVKHDELSYLMPDAFSIVFYQGRLPNITPLIHKCQLLRSEMIHFTANLHNYMMFEVRSAVFMMRKVLWYYALTSD